MSLSLCDALIARLPDGSAKPTSELEAKLAGLVERARAAWPEVEVDAAAFVGYVAERLPAEELAGGPQAVDRCLDAVHVDDLYLACGCASLLPNALLALERDFLSRLRPTPGGSAAELDEVKQSLRERLLLGQNGSAPRILQYSGAGRLGGWLQVAATRLAIKMRREPTRPQQQSDLERMAVDDARIAERDPELAYLHLRYRGAFRQAFEAALRLLPAEERTLLRLYLVDRLNIDRIGAMYGVHRATAARRLAAARQKVLELSQGHLKAELAVTSGDAMSLIRLLQSSLDVSVARILCEPDGGDAAGAPDPRSIDGPAKAR